MKKEYIRPELELIDLSAKELFLNNDIDPILDYSLKDDGIIGESIIPDDWE